MERLVICLGLQLIFCAILPMFYSLFVLDHSLGVMFSHVFLTRSNALVGFDVALCLFLLLDMVAAGVDINAICGGHQAMIQEQEMQRSFALTNPDASGVAVAAAGGEQTGVDSIHQLKALRERLLLCRETEKLRVYGVPLDESITRYLRTALVSYGLVALQSVFAKQIMHHKPVKV